MGGRRATSLSEVIGAQKYPGLEHDVHQALDDRNPLEISKAAAALARKAVSQEQAEYVALLVPFIKKQLARRRPPKDIRGEVRREWSSIKKARGIKVRRVINDAVVQSAEDYLRSRR